MSRAIKFRAWIERPVQDGPNSPVIQGHMTEEPFDFCDFDGNYFIPEGCYIEDMKIMQFTGLLDCNSKEIYEGDVLRKPNIKNAVDWICYWCERNAQFLFKRVGLENDGGYGYRDDLQVIGNIYENPDLVNSPIEVK